MFWLTRILFPSRMVESATTKYLHVGPRFDTLGYQKSFLCSNYFRTLMHASILWRRCDLVGRMRMELTRQVPCLSLRVSGIVGCYKGQLLNKVNSVFLVSLDGSWWHRSGTQAFKLGTSDSNPGSVGGYVPKMSTTKSKTRVFCLPSLRLTGWYEVRAWKAKFE